MEPVNRRQLATRARVWPSRLARALAGAGVSPNQVSVASVFFAALAAFALARAGGGLRMADSASFWLVVAAAGIQLRLLCNLLDGLLAIEGGLKTPTGELYNEMPDRIGDILILLGAGFAVGRYEWGEWLGVVATLLALLTAYVRLLGGSLGFTQDFSGPMAKQHRMFTLTVGALAGAIEHAVIRSVWSLYVALAIIVIGTLVTLALRTRRIARALRAR
jgi:phosphatidylglycerophosphate synthase